MYRVRVQGNFSSAHNLREYKGKCEELHGHNWKVEAVVAGDKLDRTGMVLDFKDLKMELNNILEKLDHKYLNDIPYFKKTNLVSGLNPTSENIAKYIYDNLKLKVRGLKSLTVWENDKSCATYER